MTYIIRFFFQFLIGTEFLDKQLVLLIADFGIRIDINFKTFLLEELDYRLNSYIQITRYFI